MRTRLRTIAGLLLAVAISAAAVADSQVRPGMVQRGYLAQAEPPVAEPRTTVPAAPAGEEPAGDEPPSDDTSTPADRPAPEGEAASDAAEADWRPEAGGDSILIDADEVYYHGGATVAEGNVTVRYRDITITADSAEIDEDGVWGQFRGNVTITRGELETHAELIRVNLDTEEWEVIGPRSTLEPIYFERGVAEPIYVRAQRVSGTGDEREVDAFDGLATSCDREYPHYGLYSDHIRIIGDETLVLERPRLSLMGTTILRIPWDLVLNQRSRNNRLFPEFGQNSVEGFYAKLAYLYLTGSTMNSYVKLHLTEKRGIGFGADHYFRTGPHSGEVSLFLQPEEGSVSGRARHAWEISEGLSSNLNVSLQENAGYWGASRSLNGNLNLRHRGEASTSTLGVDHSVTDSTYSSSTRTTTNLSHHQRLGDDAGWDLRATLRRSDYGEDRPVQEILDADFQFQQQASAFDWALAAAREWYFEGEDRRSFGLEKLPEIVINTDSRRLGDWQLFDRVPVRAKLTAGHLVQYPEEDEVSMAAIETNLGGGRTQLGDSTSMTITGGFDQAFYDDGSARYRVGGNLDLTSDFGAGWNGRVSHRYSSVDGYSPLRRDYAGRYQNTSLAIVQQSPDRSRLELTGGYDFVEDRWQELRLRGWLAATGRDRVELVAGYALHDSLWRPVQFRWTHAAPWDIYLALSSRYDIKDGKFTDADLEFDWRVSDKWRLEGITTYSGYRDELDQLNLRLTRDLHCWVANLTYNMEMDEIRLNLGIKAFPFEDRDWTLGRGGARLGSYGQYYY